MTVYLLNYPLSKTTLSYHMSQLLLSMTEKSWNYSHCKTVSSWVSQLSHERWKHFWTIDGMTKDPHPNESTILGLTEKSVNYRIPQSVSLHFNKTAPQDDCNVIKNIFIELLLLWKELSKKLHFVIIQSLVADQASKQISFHFAHIFSHFPLRRN